MQDVRPPRPKVTVPPPPRPRQAGTTLPRPVIKPVELGQILEAELPKTEPFSPLPKRRGLRWLWTSLLALLLTLVCVAAAGYFWYQDALLPRSADTTTVKIVVEPGASLETVATDLEKKAVIKSSLAMAIFVKIAGKTDIKAGTYMFAPSQPVAEIVTWLGEGRVNVFKITILPGKTLAGIKEDLIKSGYQAAEIDAAFAKHYDHPVLADAPASATLEGYLFPETYFVDANSTVQELVVRCLDELKKRIDKSDALPILQAKGMSTFQAITLASIIEKEVNSVEDRQKVSQVFARRLSLGMMLGSDVTYKYGAELLGVPASPSLDSPYNTRLVVGLPPGPIANFNFTAFEAVAHPAEGDYLYFVVGDDGITYFTRTFEEHERAILQHCHKLCSSS